MNSVKIPYDEEWNIEANKYTQAVKDFILLLKLHIFRAFQTKYDQIKTCI